MRVVFLDFDGVLNSQKFFEAQYSTLGRAATLGTPEQLDPSAIALVNDILAETGAVVVISSTWRMFGVEKCVAMLREVGLAGEVVGATPRLDGYRGAEIEHWLTLNAPPRGIAAFVILDDDSDMEPHMAKLVQTDHMVGLTHADARRAVAMLEDK